MVALAIVLSLFGFHDPGQTLDQLASVNWSWTLMVGAAATLPLLGVLIGFHYWRPSFSKPQNQFIDEVMVPMFKGRHLLVLASIAALAGFCEELLFRWALQGGLTALIGEPFGIVVGLTIASTLFGLCHWANAFYGIMAFGFGLYLGWLMIATGTVLVPAFAHFLYDLVAIIYLANRAVTSTTSANDTGNVV